MSEEGVQPQDRAGLNTLARVKKGIPLGGIGAGNFMYNLCGTFGPWQMKAGRYEERFLPQGAFHIREQVEGKQATARTLQPMTCCPPGHGSSPARANTMLCSRAAGVGTGPSTPISAWSFSPGHQGQLPGNVFARLALPVQDSQPVAIARRSLSHVHFSECALHRTTEHTDGKAKRGR